MLFDTYDECWESEKERNLYYKFFAGYFFNELVEGHYDRLSTFISLLNNNKSSESPYDNHVFGKKLDYIPSSPSHTHVTFDFYAYLMKYQGNPECDRGELADILVHDYKNNYIIAIEVKHLSNFDFYKDVYKIQKRAETLDFNTRKIHCLLINENKWIQNTKKYNHRSSNYKKLEEWGKNNTSQTLTILFWQDFFPLCDNLIVTNFLEKQVRSNKNSYRLVKGSDPAD